MRDGHDRRDGQPIGDPVGGASAPPTALSDHSVLEAAVLERVLAAPAIASVRRAGAPVLAFSGAPLRVVYANAAACGLFGGDLDQLTRRLVHGAEPGATRLVALAHGLAPGAAPRLERLRFFFGPMAETITALCQNALAPGAPVFVLAALGMRGFAAPPALDNVAALRPAAPSASGKPSSQDAAGDAASVHPERDRPIESAKPVRFAWATDAAGVLRHIDPSVQQALGAAPRVGASLRAHADALDASGALAAALEARATFAGLVSLWPAQAPAGSSLARVTLGAAPVVDAQGAFAGFRGFGVIAPERTPRPTAARDDLRSLRPHRVENQGEDDVADRVDERRRAGGAERVDSAPTAPQKDARPDRARPVGDTTRRDAIRNDDDRVPSSPASRTAIGPGEKSGQGIGRDIGQEIGREIGQDIGQELSQRIGQDNVKGAVRDDGAMREAADRPSASRAAAATGAPEPERPAPHGLTPHDDKVVSLRPARPAREAGRTNAPGLTGAEQQAFEEIARTLGLAPSSSPAGAGAAPEAAARAPSAKTPDAAPRAPTPPREPTRAARATPSSDLAAREERAALGRNASVMLDRMPVGVLVSRQNVTIYANRTLLDLLDYEDADAFHSAGGLDRLFRGRAQTPGVAEIETRDGEAVRVDARFQAIDWDGAPATLVTLRRALSPAPEPEEPQRLRALEMDLRHRDAEARELHAILDTATDGVAVIDEAGLILSLNRAGQALFGLEAADVVGAPLEALIDRESRAAVADYFSGMKSGGVASVLNDGREILARARQGGAIPAFMTMGRLGGGANTKFCVVLRDLTAWKRAERELHDARAQAERASQLKSDFLAKISHEIRTPLNAILGFTEVIVGERFGPVGNERYRDYLRDIHRSGEHVMSLVNDLLDLSKIEAGKLDLDFVAVDANAVVAESVALMQPQANRERVLMRMSLAQKLPLIVADARSLKQIVLNLLSNAVKFNEPGGQVIVSTALTDAGHAVVRIKDTGVGMSENELEFALEPFRQVATARRADGTGLGLPLTKALIEANRASFVIKSRKAEGTLVEVIFPPTRVLAE